jgi:hypothetical protein
MSTGFDIGSRVGPYEITGTLGAGGMGVVLRAIDTGLEREVAIKVLPASFTDDAERVARLEREARTLAALDHYNIAQIFGLERTEAGTALVIEHVEGPTLAAMIERGPLPVEQASEIAQQIAAALEAAHGRGVIHRDLKPANIKVRSDGVVKVLDFGLAKIVDSDGATASGSSGRLSGNLTEFGSVLGTAAYMSPEQARGRAVDKRADIWAFGAVLYEMLTGQPAFSGEDNTDIVASVLRSEPDWSLLPPLAPPVEAFLRQCLEKDPKKRVHDIADVRLALEGAYRWTPAAAAALAPLPGPRRTPVVWLGAALAALAVGIVAGFSFREDAPAPSFRQLTFENGTVGGARFRGRDIVYGASWDGEPYRIRTTNLDSFQSRTRDDIAAADLLALSDNGIAALSLDRRADTGWHPTGTLAEVDLSGGAPRALDDDIVAAEFGPDGELAAIVRRTATGVDLEFPVGTVIRTAGVILSPRVSRDGSELCFAETYGLLMLAEKGGEVRQLNRESLARISSCAFGPDGDEVWFAYAPTAGTHTTLAAVRKDGSGMHDVLPFTSYALVRDVSPDGIVLVSVGSMRFSVRGAGAADERQLDLGVFDASRLLYLTPAGDRALIWDNSGGTGQAGTLFVRRIGPDPPVTLTGVTGNGLALTPDGRYVVLLRQGTSPSGAPAHTISLQPIGVGQAQSFQLDVVVDYGATNQFGSTLEAYYYPDFSDDGTRLLLPSAHAAGAPGDARSYVYDFPTETLRPVTPIGVTGPVVLSPDGRSVASNEARGLMIYDVDSGTVRAAPGGTDPGRLLRWSNDDEFVFVLDTDVAGGRLSRRSLVTGERIYMYDLRMPDPAGVTRFEPWVSRDGQVHAYGLDRILNNLFVVEGLR